MTLPKPAKNTRQPTNPDVYKRQALNASEAFTNKAGAKLTIPRGSYLAIDNDTNGNSYIIATNRADNLTINLTTNGFANMWVGDVDIVSGKLNTSTKQYLSLIHICHGPATLAYGRGGSQGFRLAAGGPV